MTTQRHTLHGSLGVLQALLGVTEAIGLCLVTTQLLHMLTEQLLVQEVLC